MSESKKLGINLETADLPKIIDFLEKKSYLKSENILSYDDLEERIVEFTSWFNIVCRTKLMNITTTEDKDLYYYLLHNLQMCIKAGLQPISPDEKEYSPTRHQFVCSCCQKEFQIPNRKRLRSNVMSDYLDRANEHWNCITDLNQSSYIVPDYESDTSSDDSSDESSISKQQNESIKCIKSPVVSPSKESLIIKQSNEKDKEGDDDLDINNFRFNFQIKYEPLIEQTYYPRSIMQIAKRHDHLNDYTIQCSSIDKAVCLLCPCPITTHRKLMRKLPNEIKEHVNGRHHKKNAASPNSLVYIKKYHEYWKGQEFQYQSQQVYFFPHLYSIKCHLCNEVLNYNDIISHIHGEIHKSRFTSFICSPDNKDAYLVDKQMSTYCTNKQTPLLLMNGLIKNNHSSNNNNIPTTTTTPTTPKTTNSNNDNKPSEKCIILKIDLNIDINGKLILNGRFEPHNNYFQVFNNLIHCHLCNRKFPCNLLQIKNHIREIQHRQLSNIPLKPYSYFCEVCNLHFKNDEPWENHFLKGQKKHESLPELRKSKLATYECKTCSVEIFGDDLSIHRHMNKKSSNKKQNEIKLPYPVLRMFKTTAIVEEMADQLVSEAKQVSQYKDNNVGECCKDLQQTLSIAYPDCKAYAFGSRISGLGNLQSDLDIFMDVGNMYNGNNHQDPDSQERFVIQTCRLLKLNKDDFSSVIPIPAARTPIIKLKHNITDLMCDMSFRHGLGVENTEFLKYCMDLQPITQPFILMLKKWSNKCKFNENISNYALALMAIFYLQITGHLLSVKAIRELNPRPSKIIDGWETINYTVPVEKMKTFIKSYDKSIKDLLSGFFKYYSNFNYSNDVVCPLLGHVIPKFNFCEQPEQRLPIEMKTYVQKIQMNGEAFRANSPFCIQDPFDLSHNLTKACPNGTIQKFKTLCKLSYELLDSL